ncbi:hypothetical protein [Thiolapillus sp.]|uniref:hypothetical protein n=1 Tax=Thiolapillus sp. TaxID=2017437 RepID=UPI003AF7A2E1
MNPLKKSIRILLVCTAAFLFAGTAFANAEKPASSGDSNLANLIDIPGRQRMLSQKIAKAYFFYGSNYSPLSA